MKTPEEMFNALGNRGEYAALPHVTLDEVRMIYAEGQKEFKHLQAASRHMIYCRYLLKTPPEAVLSESIVGVLRQLTQSNSVINKLRTAINEAIAISGTGTPQDWTAAQVGLCRVLEEVKVMLGEKP